MAQKSSLEVNSFRHPPREPKRSRAPSFSAPIWELGTATCFATLKPYNLLHFISQAVSDEIQVMPIDRLKLSQFAFDTHIYALLVCALELTALSSTLQSNNHTNKSCLLRHS